MAGVDILAFALMPNHFHLLVRVPDRASAEPEITDRVLLDRLAAVYSGAAVAHFREALHRLSLERDPSAYEALRRRFLDRMHDLSTFVKEVKARFTMDYNRTNGRSGPLWEDRFRSVLLQGDDPALLLVIKAYIDLNPVRAGMVADPKDYRYCSYAAAVAGSLPEIAAIGRVVGLGTESAEQRREVLAQYRMLLFCQALPSSGSVHGGVKRRDGIPVDRIRQVMESGGHLPPLELLRCRIRYLTDSLALGSHGYLESLFPGRSRAPRKIGLGDLEVLRDLRGPAVFLAESSRPAGSS